MTQANTRTTRETHASYRGRPVVLTICPSWVEVRLKGTRKRFVLDAVSIYQLAAKAEADAKRREKKATRREAVKS